MSHVVCVVVGGVGVEERGVGVEMGKGSRGGRGEGK